MCLPGSAQAENSAWTSQLLQTQIVILWNCSRRLPKGSLGIFLPALMASPGTSSKHCLCTLVGPGHAEAQADELPLHLIDGALTRAICALTSPGTGRPSCLCASLAVPRQTTLPGPAICCTGMARGYIKALMPSSRLFSWQPRHKQHALPMCLTGPWPCPGAGRRTTYAPIAGAQAKAICALTSPGTGSPSCLCASLAVPRQTTLPGPASCYTSKLLSFRNAREDNQRFICCPFSCSDGSPGTSGMHCPCASVGPGHAEAQADDIPMHLLLGPRPR
jgi:hypothetical protein